MDKATRLVDRAVITLSIVLGVGSIALLMWEGRPTFVPMDLAPSTALAWDAALSLAFFVQHSGMVRRGFPRRLGRVIPARFDGAVYAIASGLALTLVMVLWQPVDRQVFVLRGGWRWVATAGTLAGIAAFVSTLFALRRTFDLLGVKPLLAHLRHRAQPSSPFVVAGPYRWVRHPLYFSVLVLLWATPDMAADRFLFAALWTAWIIVGTRLEERDLLADFGDAYRRYRRQVPMLLPWKGRVRLAPESGPGSARGEREAAPN